MFDEGEDGMARAPLTTAAFDALLASLAKIRDEYLHDEARAHDELETVEGFGYVLQMVGHVSEFLIEADRERPRFSLIVSPARKILGDNPDSIYHQAAIRGDRAYRIKGRRTGQDYISFTVHGTDPTGGYGGPVLADINDGDLVFDADDRYEIVLSADPPPDGDRAVWVRLDPDARTVLVRNYFQHETSAHNDPEIHVVLDIEPLDDLGPSPQLTDAEMAGRIHDAAAMLEAITIGLRVFGEPAKVPFVANEPNSVGTPFSFRATGEAVAGAVDIFYSSGTFQLGPDEALVMEGTIPPSRFTNVMLWNVHMQTLDYRTRCNSLNQAQIAPEPDGSYRIVISAQDPGVPNWLDTSGHRRGTIFWRFLLPESQPETPQCRVVDVADLRPSGAAGRTSAEASTR
jgi:hypothetical protein